MFPEQVAVSPPPQPRFHPPTVKAEPGELPRPFHLAVVAADHKVGRSRLSPRVVVKTQQASDTSACHTHLEALCERGECGTARAHQGLGSTARPRSEETPGPARPRCACAGGSSGRRTSSASTEGKPPQGRSERANSKKALWRPFFPLLGRK